jgi:hypothetical protein
MKMILALGFIVCSQIALAADTKLFCIVAETKGTQQMSYDLSAEIKNNSLASPQIDAVSQFVQDVHIQVYGCASCLAKEAVNGPAIATSITNLKTGASSYSWTGGDNLMGTYSSDGNYTGNVRLTCNLK